MHSNGIVDYVCARSWAFNEFGLENGSVYSVHCSSTFAFWCHAILYTSLSSQIYTTNAFVHCPRSFATYVSLVHKAAIDYRPKMSSGVSISMRETLPHENQFQFFNKDDWNKSHNHPNSMPTPSIHLRHHQMQINCFCTRNESENNGGKPFDWKRNIDIWFAQCQYTTQSRFCFLFGTLTLQTE